MAVQADINPTSRRSAPICDSITEPPGPAGPFLREPHKRQTLLFAYGKHGVPLLMARSSRLSTYIRQWRESRGLTLEQLAEAIGVTHPTLSRIENGKVEYTEERLERIADELQAHRAVIPLEDRKSVV